MKATQFKQFRFIIIGLTAIITVVSFALKSSLLALLAFGSGMALLSLVKISVKDTLGDERTNTIHEKASKTAFSILLPILSITTIILFASATEEFLYLKLLGTIFGYITALAVTVYSIAYYYFNRKL